MLSCCQMTILLAVFSRPQVLPIRVSITHLWMQAESVNRCNIVTFHKSGKFMPLMLTLSSDRFVLGVLLWSHPTGIFHDSPTSDKRACVDPHAEIVPIYTPFAGSSLHTLERTSSIIVLRGSSSTLSSQLVMTSGTT